MNIDRLLTLSPTFVRKMKKKVSSELDGYPIIPRLTPGEGDD